MNQRDETAVGVNARAPEEAQSEPYRVFFSAGESSGDMHGAGLIRALRELDPSVRCEGLGGTHMAKAGMKLRYDLASQAIMGFVEVVRRFGMIHRLFLDTARHLDDTQPDCVVLIDFPGFNLQLAKRAALMGVPVVYYISPQVWAWKRGRIYTLAQVVDKMLVILPFEEELYREVGLDCAFVGHPLLDHVVSTPIEGLYRDGLVIGLLPGSREQEIGRLLRPMLDVAKGIRERHPSARFVVPCVDAARETQIRSIADGFPIETAMGKTYEVLDGSRFCLVASGTATLEAALLGVPMVILYKVNWLSYVLARMLVHVKHIGLVNILAGRGIIPEFIQGAACARTVLPVALELIDDSPRRAQMIADLREVKEGLGGPGASRRAAEEVLALIRRKRHAG